MWSMVSEDFHCEGITTKIEEGNTERLKIGTVSNAYMQMNSKKPNKLIFEFQELSNFFYFPFETQVPCPTHHIEYLLLSVLLFLSFCEFFELRRIDGRVEDVDHCVERVWKVRT